MEKHALVHLKEKQAMKWCLVLTLGLLTGTLFGQQLSTINPVIGDVSFVTKYGEQPDLGCDETDRIKTHLAYVEEKLRVSDVRGLTNEQLQKRAEILNHLRDYWQREQFPVNSLYETERRPCFIDEKGTICAVGYLIEQTEGRAAAEAINDRYQYATISEMTDKLPEIEQWANENGLTVNECAMIQPTYAWKVVRLRRNYFGMQAGYTSAFASDYETLAGGSVSTRPGFEVAFTYNRYLKPYLRMQTSVGYVSRNFAVSAAGETFDLRNDRWFVSSLAWFSPFANHRSMYLKRIGVKTGLQIDFYNQSSPITVLNRPNGTWNKVVKSSAPECLLVGELSYAMKPLRFAHSISVSYSHGLRNTLKGEIGTPSETNLRYSNSGSYLGVKYTFWFQAPKRR